MCGPVALVMGLKSLNAIKAQPHLGGHEAMTGFVLGVIATLLLVLSILFIAFMIWFAVEYPEEFRRALEEKLLTGLVRVPWLPSARECEIITAPNRTDRHIQRGGQA